MFERAYFGPSGAAKDWENTALWTFLPFRALWPSFCWLSLLWLCLFCRFLFWFLFFWFFSSVSSLPWLLSTVLPRLSKCRKFDFGFLSVQHRVSCVFSFVGFEACSGTLFLECEEEANNGLDWRKVQSRGPHLTSRENWFQPWCYPGSCRNRGSGHRIQTSPTRWPGQIPSWADARMIFKILGFRGWWVCSLRMPNSKPLASKVSTFVNQNPQVAGKKASIHHQYHHDSRK